MPQRGPNQPPFERVIDEADLDEAHGDDADSMGRRRRRQRLKDDIAVTWRDRVDQAHCSVAAEGQDLLM